MSSFFSGIYDYNTSWIVVQTFCNGMWNRERSSSSLINLEIVKWLMSRNGTLNIILSSW